MCRFAHTHSRFAQTLTITKLGLTFFREQRPRKCAHLVTIIVCVDDEHTPHIVSTIIRTIAQQSSWFFRLKCHSIPLHIPPDLPMMMLMDATLSTSISFSVHKPCQYCDVCLCFPHTKHIRTHTHTNNTNTTTITHSHNRMPIETMSNTLITGAFQQRCADSNKLQGNDHSAWYQTKSNCVLVMIA